MTEKATLAGKHYHVTAGLSRLEKIRMIVWPVESMSVVLPQQRTGWFLAVNIHFADFCSGFMHCKFQVFPVYFFPDELYLTKPNHNQTTTVLHHIVPRFLFLFGLSKKTTSIQLFCCCAIVSKSAKKFRSEKTNMRTLAPSRRAHCPKSENRLHLEFYRFHARNAIFFLKSNFILTTF